VISARAGGRADDATVERLQSTKVAAENVPKGCELILRQLARALTTNHVTVSEHGGVVRDPGYV
jgi:molecular chaperone GrpE (heat shock protein)